MLKTIVYGSSEETNIIDILSLIFNILWVCKIIIRTPLKDIFWVTSKVQSFQNEEI